MSLGVGWLHGFFRLTQIHLMYMTLWYFSLLLYIFSVSIFCIIILCIFTLTSMYRVIVLNRTIFPCQIRKFLAISLSILLCTLYQSVHHSMNSATWWLSLIGLLFKSSFYEVVLFLWYFPSEDILRICVDIWLTTPLVTKITHNPSESSVNIISTTSPSSTSTSP
jgi:hypothetical protein